MASIIVKDMCGGYVYNFSVTSSSMSIKDLKQTIKQHLSSTLSSDISLIYEALDCNFLQIYVNYELACDEHLVMDLLTKAEQTSNDRVFYLILAPPSEEKCVNNENSVVDPTFDRASMIAAVNWYIENSSCDENENIDVLNDFLQYDDLGMLCYGEQKKQITSPQDVRTAANRIGRDIQWFNLNAFLSVLARIIICCMWFGRGGVSSFPVWKITAVAGGIVIGYLIEIGLLSKLLRQLTSNQFSFLRDFSLPNETLYETVARLSHSAAAIPTQRPHIIYDMYAFIMSLLLSFFPSWQPRAAVEPMPPVVQPPPPQQQQQVDI